MQGQPCSKTIVSTLQACLLTLLKPLCWIALCNDPQDYGTAMSALYPYLGAVVRCTWDTSWVSWTDSGKPCCTLSWSTDHIYAPGSCYADQECELMPYMYLVVDVHTYSQAPSSRCVRHQWSDWQCSCSDFLTWQALLKFVAKAQPNLQRHHGMLSEHCTYCVLEVSSHLD